jgi:endoglucanase Acf2
MNRNYILRRQVTQVLILLLIFLFQIEGFGQFVNVGSGGYTTQHPGYDSAGRNHFPTGTPYTTGVAATKPAPTNDWWSKKIKESHADNLFNYPFTMKTVNSGLVVTYIPWGVIDAFTPVTVGVSGLNASAVNVADFSDWTVTMDWSNAGHNFQATAGIGMPFIYFTKDSADVASITITSGSVVVSSEMIVITDAHLGADFAIYAPVGSTWSQSGNTYTSTLNGKNYWSLGFIPLTATNVSAVANEYKKYAYVFPSNTYTSWEYDESTSVVRTEFTIETDVKEGNDTTILQGLLPHQWSNLATNSPTPNGYSYETIRGELKTLDGNSFSVENTFHGILPTLPYLDYYSAGFSPQKIKEKVELIENDGLATWTDSYNEGQVMNRLIQTARIADLTGDTTARGKILTTIKTRLEDWLKAESGEVAFLFYYYQPWSVMIGYPAGHGQDNNINDHHFHWGYFIHAASFLEQFDPGWVSQWGGMIDHLIRDAANPKRDDPMYPFLRNFSPYAGHCWANGFASFPQGNDQESTSESMQFNSSLIHWGSITGNDSIRDLGIYLYTTEQTAIEEYWFDMYDRVFGPTQQYSLVSRVWGNSYDNGTFWTSDIAASYGIEMYPIHGGSLYLGQDTNYVDQIWSEIEQHTGIITNEVNPNLWHDVMWEYLAFIDPQAAIDMYDSYPERELKFGISDAQTYHWLHAMNVLGRVNAGITADHALAAAFTLNGDTTFVAHNYGMSPIDVTFSNGYVLTVPAQSMATSKDISITGTLSSSFPAAYPGGSVELNLSVSNGTPTLVEFVNGETMIGQASLAPYTFEAANLGVGKHSFYARIYDGSNFAISNLVTVIVGEQLPFLGSPPEIPGSIQAGHFDIFEGGIGQGISYSDVSPENIGDFRETEYVDASMDFAEGAFVGWIANGEWLEYTIDVQQAGNYSLVFRYACGNQSGGGPFRMESDGVLIKSGITVNYTGDWSAWSNKTVNDIPLKSGTQVLRLFFENGELNLGNMTFTYSSPLSYDQPVADAGANILVQLPATTTTLDGSNSTNPGTAVLSYNWTQVYGPSTLVFSNTQIAQPGLSGLVEGVYKIVLTVDNGSYADTDDLYVISTTSNNVPPSVSIFSPANNSEYLEDETIMISALASDLIGTVDEVEFFVDNVSIGTDTQFPYESSWTPGIGQYSLTAVATDNDGSSTTSEVVNVTIEPAPPCYATSSNGEFDYEWSPDDNNPTITFIPSLPGMGSPTCILYYGTNPGALPGYPVTPNVPYQISASEGELIYFYYTYSYPGQGEHNNSANKDSYVVGSCKVLSIDPLEEDMQVKYYPNPVTDILNMEFPVGKNDVNIYDYTGKVIANFASANKYLSYDMSKFESGLYLFKVVNGTGSKVFKVIK